MSLRSDRICLLDAKLILRSGYFKDRKARALRGMSHTKQKGELDLQTQHGDALEFLGGL